MHSCVCVPRYSCWLDVKMPKQDMDAMKEGVEQSDCVVAIITGGDVKEHRYFERPMCVQELTWAIEVGKTIVPVVVADDKKNVGAYIKEGISKGIDLSACDFKHVDRSNSTMMQASPSTHMCMNMCMGCFAHMYAADASVRPDYISWPHEHVCIHMHLCVQASLQTILDVMDSPPKAKIVAAAASDAPQAREPIGVEQVQPDLQRTGTSSLGNLAEVKGVLAGALSPHGVAESLQDKYVGALLKGGYSSVVLIADMSHDDFNETKELRTIPRPHRDLIRKQAAQSLRERAALGQGACCRCLQ